MYWRGSGDFGRAAFFLYFSAFEPATQPLGIVQMRTGLFKPGARGSLPSLPLSYSRARRWFPKGAPLNRKPIEEIDRPDSKLTLSLRERTDYVPRTTRLAMKLWQTKGGVQ